MANGATLTDPETVWFALDTVVGRDVTIGPNVVFGPGVTVESGATIHAFCHLEGCHVSRGAIVGPFARLRPGAELAEDVHVGNFVEVKNAIVDEGAKINHLTYVGDAHVGARANIGAGHDHLQLRRRVQAPHRDRRRRLHRLERGAGGPGRASARARWSRAGSTITEDVPDERAGGRARPPERQAGPRRRG